MADVLRPSDSTRTLDEVLPELAVVASALGVVVPADELVAQSKVRPMTREPIPVSAEQPLSVDALADELLVALRDHPDIRMDPANGEADRRLAAAYNRLYCELHDKEPPAIALLPPQRTDLR